MKIQEVKVEAVDKKTGFVLKRIKTDSGEFFNRKLAVSNTLYICERARAKLDKPLIETPFQTHHLKWNKNDEEWELKGLKKERQHAEENNRIFMLFNQRNAPQWSSLKWKESLEDFKDLLRKTDVVPLSIPVDTSLDEWEGYKQEALSYLSEGQIIMPILSSKHDIRHFPDIVQNELTSSIFLGISCYELTGTAENMNLAFVKSLNSKLKVGDNSALITYFNHERVMKRHLQVAGSFAFSCLGGDVFSQRANFGIDFENIENLKPEDLYCYDNKEKKFTKSNAQKQRYGFDFTNELISNIPLSSGLDFHQAIKFLSQTLQQQDLDLINGWMVQNEPLEIKIRDYTGWGVFWDTEIKPNLTIL